MLGIYVAALLTMAVSLAVYGSILVRIAPHAERKLILVAVLGQLPMSAVMYYVVRVPIDQGLSEFFASNPSLTGLRLLYAPLTEEPAKLWLLLLPWFARQVTRHNAARVAMALGLGFGIGEIVFLANLLGADPKLSVVPWYMLGGFFSERFFVCLVHGLFTTMALYGLRVWRGGWLLGLLAAMSLHGLGNLPILLANWGVFGANQEWANFSLQLWVMGLWVLALCLFSWLNFGTLSVGGLLFGMATCPKCSTTYQRPLLGLNLVLKRLERCPHCQQWNVL